MTARAAPAVVAFVLVLPLRVPPQPQPQPLDQILVRLHVYLKAYEEALSVIVADEVYEQRTMRPRRGALSAGPTGALIDPEARPLYLDSVRRRLQSAVSFMRLPGGAAWLGIREIRRVDNRAVSDSQTLLAILTGKGGDAYTQAGALAQASARYNLGFPRNVNMPTLPLELLDSRHRDRMEFRVTGSDSLRGVRTTRVAFDEKGPPTLIRGEGDGHWVIARGFVWIDNESGAVWRAQVLYRDYVPGRTAVAPEGEVSVDFVRHAALGMLVPERMREVFHVEEGRGEGEAKYSNYRRFTTSARIVPQD